MRQFLLIGFGGQIGVQVPQWPSWLRPLAIDTPLIFRACITCHNWSHSYEYLHIRFQSFQYFMRRNWWPTGMLAENVMKQPNNLNTNCHETSQQERSPVQPRWMICAVEICGHNPRCYIRINGRISLNPSRKTIGDTSWYTTPEYSRYFISYLPQRISGYVRYLKLAYIYKLIRFTMIELVDIYLKDPVSDGENMLKLLEPWLKTW